MPDNLSHDIVRQMPLILETSVGKTLLAPAESGNYTEKYDKAAEMIAAYDPLASTLDRRQFLLRYAIKNKENQRNMVPA